MLYPNFHIFQVFQDRPLSKSQKIFSVIGTIAFVPYIILQIFYPFVRDVKGPMQGFITTFELFGTWGFFIGFFLLGVVSIEYVGSSFGKKTFWGSLLVVLAKVLKYILLPAIIITALLMPVMFSSYHN